MSNADRELYVRLSALGQTADEVARNLADLGYKGTPNEAEACPVASFLEARYPNACSVRVANRAIVGYATDSGGVSAIETMTPWGVTAFIRDFDGGAYPELEE